MTDLVYFETVAKLDSFSPLPPYQDEEGNWITPSATSSALLQACRAEVNGSSTLVLQPDGKYVSYAWMIYLPVDSVKFVFGENVIINDGAGNKKGEGSVKRFSRDLLHCRLWI